MPVNPFTTYNSNERVVAIPVVPLAATGSVSAAATAQIALIPGITAGTGIVTYLYYIVYNASPTAAASAIEIVTQWQFQTAAHVAVGGPTFAYIGSAGASGATCQLSHCHFEPFEPLALQFTVPATATEIALQLNSFGIIGAPTIRCTVGFSVDTLNSGIPGGIGGYGMVAQSATSPNTF